MFRFSLAGLIFVATSAAAQQPDDCALAAERAMVVLSEVWREQGKLPDDFADKRETAVKDVAASMRDKNGADGCGMLLMLPETTFEALMRQSVQD